MSQITQKRILTGDRPTGKLHLGHYIGTLQNRVRFQQEFDTFLLVADYHTLTTHPEKEDVLRTRQNALDVVIDNYAAGIEPDRVTRSEERRVGKECRSRGRTWRSNNRTK